MKEVLPKVEAIAREAASAVGVEFIRLECRRVSQGKTSSVKKERAFRQMNSSSYSWILSVCIHRESGTSIKDCEDVSRFMERRLDEADLIQEQYSLEVASRGI